MSQTENTTADVVRQILSLTDYSRMMGAAAHPGQGQFVVTGPQMGGSPERRMGFCVQVRKKCGQFGSDMVFLRHPDGSLTTHENQCYFAMGEEQERLARPLFASLPEDEDYSQGYRCCDKVHEVGFVIEQSGSQPSPAGPAMMTMTQVNADGTKSATCISFV